MNEDICILVATLLLLDVVLSALTITSSRVTDLAGSTRFEKSVRFRDNFNNG